MSDALRLPTIEAGSELRNDPTEALKKADKEAFPHQNPEPSTSPIRLFDVADNGSPAVVDVHMLDADKLLPAITQAAKDFHLHKPDADRRKAAALASHRSSHVVRFMRHSD